MPHPAGAWPFDELAADYDSGFTASRIGSVMRRAVRRRVEGAFAPGDRVLDIGCGTGEDALELARRGIRVVAADRSAEMLAAARGKLEAARLADRVELRRVSIEALAAELLEGAASAEPFDGALSNFGALNCVADLRPVARALAAVVRPGGRVLLCLMGRCVPWEWLWYLAAGEPRKAFRRLRRAGVEWRGVRVFYPPVSTVRRTFAADFRPRRTAAVGALVPPTYAESWARRHPRLLARLDRWERRLETVPPLPRLADHYLLELARR